MTIQAGSPILASDILALAGNNNHGTQTYSTAGTYTWTAPEGISIVYVNLIGGGGGGNRGGASAYCYYYSGSGAGGGSGAPGEYIFAIHPVTAGTSYTVVVGAGGSANGGTGGYSRFGDIRASGGGGGKAGANHACSGTVSGGAGGTTNASTNIIGFITSIIKGGKKGADGSGYTDINQPGGAQATGYMSAGYGGAGGSGQYSNSYSNGAAGGAGKVVISW